MQLCQNEYNMLLFGVYQNKTLMPLVPRVSATVLDMMDSRPLSRLLRALMTLVHTVQSSVNDWYQKLLWSTTVILPSEFLKSEKKIFKIFPISEILGTIFEVEITVWTEKDGQINWTVKSTNIFEKHIDTFYLIWPRYISPRYGVAVWQYLMFWANKIGVASNKILLVWSANGVVNMQNQSRNRF